MALTVNSIFPERTFQSPRSEVKRMRKKTMFAIAFLLLVLIPVLSLPQGFAKPTAQYQVKPSAPSAPQYTYARIGLVSSPTGSCGNLGVSGFYGDVLVTHGKLKIGLMFVNPSSTYSVAIAKVNSYGVCDGTWTSLGSINTDQVGHGELTQKDGFSGSYVFEFTNSAGNLVYATPSISL
jgi:hypothetical protein